MRGLFNMVDQRLTSLLSSVAKYLEKAVRARESFYKGMEAAARKALEERQPNLGPEDAKYSYGKSLQGAQQIADNKWHMAQSRTFALAAIARGVWILIKEQQRTNVLMEENNELLKEVRNALRNGRDPGQRGG